MSIFNMYLHLGFDYIANLYGYDHILFIVTLCGVYILSQWKNVIVLVTAFTIGHSITLALATLRIITIPSNIIEFLIPVANIVYKKNGIFYIVTYIQIWNSHVFRIDTRPGILQIPAQSVG
jgi:hypothetical protein